MKIELHMIQNFAPSCLNRDDTNTPKDCEFGGVRRARISSQCIKRAIRTCFNNEGLLPAENIAKRTKRLVDRATGQLVSGGRDEAKARAAVEALVRAMGLAVDDAGQTQYLIFLGEDEIGKLVAVCEKHWDALAASQTASEDEDVKKTSKAAKKAAKEAISKEIKDDLRPVLDGSKAADLALFGRMLADLPKKNVNAACQVAHAISTNKVSMEMDFFTAVDDLKTADEDAGAGMMGIIGYNSACFYRYAVLDWGQLLENLGNEKELAWKTVDAFLRASALAVPSGKQNTFAAHSRPDFIVAVVREKGAPLSLANAFVGAARPHGEATLTQASVDQMAEYWCKIQGVYGSDGLAAQPCCGPTPPLVDGTGWTDVKTLDALVTSVLDAIGQGGET